MRHLTETGPYLAAPRNRLDASHGGSITAKFKNIVNHPLPWFGVAMLLAAISLATAAYALAVCHQAKQDAWQAETQSLLLRDHVDQLRFELASHGIKPPALPAELKR